MNKVKKNIVGVLVIILSIFAGGFNVWANDVASQYKSIGDTKPLQSYEELIKVLDEKKGLTVEYDTGSANTQDIAASSNAIDNYSQTNIQVKDVDEADIVKTDERYIYSCIGGKELVIVDTKDKMKQVAKISVGDQEKNYNMDKFFLDKDYLTLVLNGSEGSRWAENDGRNPFKQFTIIKVYNISNRKNPTLAREVKIEGSLNEVRKVKNQLYVVTNKSVEYWRSKTLSKEMFKKVIVPHYKDSAVSDEVKFIPVKNIRYCDWSSCSNYTVLANFNIDDKKPISFNVLLGDRANLYMNQDAIYLVSNLYDWGRVYSSSSNTTVITKYGIYLGKISYKCVGSVPGAILNQFSMDAYKGYFRIATTSYIKGEEYNNVYVLDDRLKVCGKVEGLAKGERIYSVRFDGDRGYMVTFKEMDPLFVIDLSNPKAPQAVGKLKIPGFSQYLHPIGEDLVVGIGRSTGENIVRDENGKERVTGVSAQGIKLSLLNVKNPKSPVEVNHIIIGTSGSYSEALENHLAVMVDPKRRILAIPVILEFDKPVKITEDYEAMNFQGAYVFDVEYGKLVGKAKLGQLDAKTRKYVPNYRYTESRVCYIGDKIYYLYNNQINQYDMRLFECKDVLVLDQ